MSGFDFRGIHPDFLALLKEVGVQDVRAVEMCGTHGIRTECEAAKSDGSHYPTVFKVWLCHRNKECYRCAAVESKRLRTRWVEFFVAASKRFGLKPEFIKQEYTFPKEIWPKITEGNMNESVGLVRKAVKTYFGPDVLVGAVPNDFNMSVI